MKFGLLNNAYSTITQRHFLVMFSLLDALVAHGCEGRGIQAGRDSSLNGNLA